MEIVVTGASSGIGREVVRKFSHDSRNRIIAVSRNEAALKTLSDASAGATIIGMPFDITDGLNGLKKLKKGISGVFSGIDILVNCAGQLVNKPFTDHTAEDINTLVSVNFTGTASLIQVLLPLLRKGSHVVSLGSMGGFQGSVKFPGLSYYSATKGAIAILTECLAREYSDSGISFNCLCPGAVETDMFRQAFPGYKAPVSGEEMAAFIAEFAINGHKYFNGKVLPVAVTTP